MASGHYRTKGTFQPVTLIFDIFSYVIGVVNVLHITILKRMFLQSYENKLLYLEITPITFVTQSPSNFEIKYS